MKKRCKKAAAAKIEFDWEERFCPEKEAEQAARQIWMTAYDRALLNHFAEDQMQRSA